ncbi:MAG: serine hydrolase [Pseudomonadales bacterium]|nr:serine hydrolase [Pseudomonadales bacterium]
MAGKVDTGGQTSTINLAAVAARGREHALTMDFRLPPGDPVSHFGAGFAATMAANHFISGLPLDFCAEHVGYFTAPYADRRHVVDYSSDEAARAVHVKLDNGVTRTARMFGSQGAISLPLGSQGIHFAPSVVEPDPWAQRDGVSPEEIVLPESEALSAALDHAFIDEAMTAAMIITHRGRIVAERYRPGIGIGTPLESWSMGKSLTATMLARLIHEGVYDLWQPAPIPEWQTARDPRHAIRIADILRMSSGLRFRAMQDPDYDPGLGYPDHLYVYTGGIDAFRFCANLASQWAPNIVGRYRNCDPVLINYLIRLAVEKRGKDYHSWPQRNLFDPLGITSFTLETDPYGNFLTQGYEFATARDWARLGNLYLQGGVWNGERLLPEGWCSFASTLAPAWVDDGRPIYGAFFWVNGDGVLPLPKDAYFMGGAGLQRTFIVPSHDLCVVRLGHYSGMEAGTPALKRSLAAIIEAIG